MESRVGGKNILNELIEEKRIEIVWKIKETSSEEFWMKLTSDRSTVGQKLNKDQLDEYGEEAEEAGRNLE